MVTYEPKTVYRRTQTVDGDVPVYSFRGEFDVDAERAKNEHLKAYGGSLFDEAMKAVQAMADSQQKADSLEDLQELTDFLSKWESIVKDAKSARKELTLKLLIDGEDLDEVKKAVGKSTSWLTIQSWAGQFSGIGPKRKFVKWIVPKSIGEAINEKTANNRGRKSAVGG